VMKGPARLAAQFAALLLAWLGTVPAASAEDLPEYRLKAAFVYNFLAYTDWPADTGATLTLCLRTPDPFGREIDGLQGKPVGTRTLAVQRRGAGESLKGCQAVFLPAAAPEALARAIEPLRELPMLTLADTPGAMRRGVMLNMTLANGRVAFEANLQAARAAGLGLSAKLLRLATEVQQ
jgi:YfiR/HmsC-like